MNAAERLHAVLAEVRALVRSQPDLAAFVGAELDAPDYAPVAARHLPAVDRMLQDTAPVSRATEALTDAIRRTASVLQWSQSYSEAEVGARFLQGYAWFDLVSPNGPFCHGGLRVAVGYWAQGLHYPEHKHGPEEVYCVLAGSATFSAAGRAPVTAGPGDLIHHPPWMPHAIDMADSSLLAIAFWRGVGLTDVSQLGAVS